MMKKAYEMMAMYLQNKGKKESNEELSIHDSWSKGTQYPNKNP